MILLAVDTALGACSAALLCEGRAVYRFAPMARGHAEALAPMVADVMAEAGLAFADIDRLAVTVGPGTFTGQRIGLAFMRGLRIALDRPLNGVSSLAAMGRQALDEKSGAETAAVMHDARRGEVYFETVGQVTFPPQILPFGEACEKLTGIGALVLAGTAATAAAEKIPAPVSPVTAPDARWVGKLAAAAAPQTTPPRPLYLRAPDAKLPASHRAPPPAAG